MAKTEVAAPYARALLDVAQAKRQGEKVGKEMQVLADLIDGSAEFRRFLANPVISDADRRGVVGALAKKKLFSKLTTNFLLLLADKRRLGCLREVAGAYSAGLDAAQGIVRAEVLSSVKLSTMQVSRLRTTLEGMTGKKVTVDPSIDDTLLGGLVVRMEGKVYDNSVKTQLAVLKDNVRRV